MTGCIARNVSMDAALPSPSRAIRQSVTRSLVALCLATTALVTPALATSGSDSQHYLDEAKNLSAKGDVATAIIQLKNAVRSDPDNSEARYQLALLYLQTNDPGSARRELESARARSYDENKIVPPLTQAYLQQAQYADLIRNFDPNKYQGETRSVVLVAKARAYLGLGDAANAHKLMDLAVHESPEDPAVLIADAVMRRADKDVKGAEAQVDKALVKRPEQIEYLMLKGELRQQQGDLAGALAAFDKAVAKAPRDSRPRLDRALANLSDGKFDAVNADLAPVLATEPQNPVALYLKAFMIAKSGKFKEASDLLIAKPQLVESYPPARLLLAQTSFATGNLDFAASNAESYVNKVPNDVNGIKLLATVYQRSGNTTKAVQLLEPLTARLSSDKAFKLQLAELYMAVGRSEEAIKLFREGVDADPTNDNARVALAAAQISAGATDKGVEELQKLIAAKPDSLQANAALIFTYLQTGQNAKALDAAKALVKSAPTATAYNLQGTVYLATNDLAAARTAFSAALDKDPKFAAAALNLGRVAERANDAAAAEGWYNKALAIDAKNVTAFQGLANLALQRQDYDSGIKYLERAIELNPKASQPRLRLIALFLDRKENSRALIAAHAFNSEMPDDPESINALGRAELTNGDFTNAISNFQHLVALYPKNAEAERRLGHAYAAAGRMPEARAAFDQAVMEDPDSLAALQDRVTVERQIKDQDQAIALAEKYVAERPASVPRLLVLGDQQLSAQRNDAALATYRKAWAKEQTGVTLERVYAALERTNKPDEGLKMLQDWSAKNPADYTVRFMIASHYIATGNYDEALKETQAMDGTLPDNPLFLNNIAWLYGTKNDPRAIPAAEKAYRLAPQSPNVIDTLGWIYVNQGNASRGTELLGKAFEMAPKSPEIAYHYAAALKRNGDTARAKDVLGPALDVKATFSDRPKAEALYKELGG